MFFESGLAVVLSAHARADLPRPHVGLVGELLFTLPRRKLHGSFSSRDPKTQRNIRILDFGSRAQIAVLKGARDFRGLDTVAINYLVTPRPL